MATPQHVLEFFSFEDYIDKHLRKHCDSEGFVTVFDITDTPSEFRKITCALLPIEKSKNDILDYQNETNLAHYCGIPQILEERVPKKDLNETKYTYSRFGNNENIKPLVIERSTDRGLYEDYIEFQKNLDIYSIRISEKMEQC